MARRILKVARRLAFIRPLRFLSWALLASAVAVTAFGLPDGVAARMASGAWPRLLHHLPAAVFGAFLLGFSVYRFALVRAGRYHAGKAFLQVGLGALVLAYMVATGVERDRAAAHAGEGVARPAAVDLAPLLTHAQPEVRAVACEALAHRPTGDPARPLARRLAGTDPDPRVRTACAAVP